MATLIHRETVSIYWITLGEASCRTASLMGRIGGLAEKSLEKAVTGTKQEE